MFKLRYYDSYIFNLFLTVITSIFFQTNPLNSMRPRYDQAIFQYYGMAMHMGLIPYRNIFDNKGPVLFIIEYIGSIANNNLFLFVMEFVAVYIAYLYIYKSLLFFSSVMLTKMLLLINLFSVILFLIFNTNGNTCEEFALPLISYSLFVFLKLLLRKDVSLISFFLLGLCFSLTFFIKINMISIWLIIFSFLIYKILISRGKIRNIFTKQLITLIISFLLFNLIIVSYCIHLHMFKDMLNQSILFNAVYSTSIKFNVLHLFKIIVLFTFFTFMLALSPLFLLIISRKSFSSNYNFSFNKKLLVFISSYYVLDFISMLISQRPYLHYCIIQIPISLVISSIGIMLLKDAGYSNFIKRLLICMATINLFSLIIGIATSTSRSNIELVNPRDENIIIANINRYKFSSDNGIFVYHDPYIYLASKQVANSRYFALPNIKLKKNLFITKSFWKNWYSNRPTYVVMPSIGSGLSSTLNDPCFKRKIYKDLNTHYKLLKVTKTLTIYVINKS